MPRRALARGLISASATPHAQSPALLSSEPVSPELLLLRQQWKWAAFSQFFFTFAPLFNMSDVTIADIEDDLTRSTGVTLPRIMQRLLYTLSYDRKVNLDNWQTVLRKQYLKRDPEANPIGPEPPHPSEQESSPDPEPLTADPMETKPEEGEPDAAATALVGDAVKEEVGSDAEAPESRRITTTPEHQDTHSPHASKYEGTPIVEESKNWLDLPMLEKLDSMHLLTEWEFHNPQRVRTLMKDDDEGAFWRIEPIGYDAKSNAYWLIGADRLWIQRVPPKPSHQRKRKRPASGDADIPQAKRADRGKNKTSKTVATKSGQSSASQALAPRGNGRAAKVQAKIKLDAQAKELADFQRQAASSVKSKGRTLPPPPRGTRLSKRLRGPIEEDGWQPVPDDWLEDQSSPSRAQPSRAIPKTGLESDDESTLTSLSDDEEAEPQPIKDEDIDHAKTDATDNLDDRGIEIPAETPKDFVEWETIAVTLYEWEHVAEPFEKATHYTEKALYKVLTVDIAPAIVAELKEIVRQRQLEEAVVHRKRSSRIAIKESEKEEAQLAAQRKAEEAEKMSRAQRLEARQQREEAERIKRETAREQRRKEREERDARIAQKAADQRYFNEPLALPATHSIIRSNDDVDVVGDGVHLKTPRINGSATNRRQHQVPSASNGSIGGARTPDWELDLTAPSVVLVHQIGS
ncbi:hypothetical protein HWV62_44657 [Athelia sp. TMB]|nr:hypothetical protein HWV62_44657 [Athelia sp. TMB]